MAVVPRRPLLVTGMARAGTSWVGKMLEASGAFVYINEPLNPQHPPGQSPGILLAPVPYQYLYIVEEEIAATDYRAAFFDMLRFRYHTFDELKQNHTPFELLRLVKYWSSFAVGRLLGKRPMVDDTYSVLSAKWFIEQFGAQVVAVVRQPAALVASYRRLGLAVDFRNLLQQPTLMRDWLEPFRSEMEAMPEAPNDVIGRVCLLWRIIYHVVAQWQGRLPDFHVVQHEDLSTEPVRGFSQLYADLGLPFTRRVRDVVVRSSTGRSKERAHAWQFSRRGWLSRTAFRPMDSRANLIAWTRRVTPDEVSRIRSLTKDVGSLFYTDQGWDSLFS